MKYINNISDNTVFGIYVITVEYNNLEKIYIGSTTNFKNRFKQHISKLKNKSHNSKFLQRIFNKYSDLNVTFEAKWIFKDQESMLLHEGLLIRLFKPELNSCLFPEVNGKPNYKRKLPDDWKANINNGGYTHTDSGNLEKISKQNNEGGTKIKTTDRKTGEILIFNTMSEFNTHFDKSFYITRLMNPNCRMHKTHVVELIKTQTKKVICYKNNKELFQVDTAGECDRKLNLWRGATSDAICNKNGILHEYVVEYV